MNKLNESILDPVQKYHCDALFNQNDKSDQPVILFQTKQFIFSILDSFKEAVKIKKMEYTQAFIVGSSLGFQYRDDSDIDVDVRVNLTREELKGKFHCIPKNILLPGTAHPINIFVLTADDADYDFSLAENAYDLLTDTWIKQGKLENSDAIPYEYVAGVSEFYMDGIVLEFSRAERDLYDLKKYIGMDPNKVAISESERKAAISQKISDLIIDKDALKLAHTLMFRLDCDGFGDKPIRVSIKYQYQDKHYSMNNLIYKYIDKFGYFEKIEDMAKTIDAAIKEAKAALAEVVEDSPETRNTASAQEEIAEKAMSTEVPEAAPVEESAPEQPQEDVSQEQQQVESQPQDQAQLTESYSDTELKSILVENGYGPTNLNVLRLKQHSYIITEAYDDEYDKYLYENWEDFKAKLKEKKKARFQDKTLKSLDKTIFKASGKWSIGGAAVIGWLLAGVIGSLIAYEIGVSHNISKDEFEADLLNKVQYDDECQDIIDEIKAEIKVENPNKEKLKDLKKKFAAAVGRCKREVQEDRYEPTRQDSSVVKKVART